MKTAGTSSTRIRSASWNISIRSAGSPMNEAASLTSLVEFLVGPGVASAGEPDREHVVWIEEVHAVSTHSRRAISVGFAVRAVHEGILIDVLHLDRDA